MDIIKTAHKTPDTRQLFGVCRIEEHYALQIDIWLMFHCGTHGDEPVGVTQHAILNENVEGADFVEVAVLNSDALNTEFLK